MKNARQAAILAIIEHDDIETQEELALALRQRGFAVTQATVSRDIKELKLLKVSTARGTYKYATSGRAETSMNDRFVRIFSHAVISIESAQNIVVIKTLPGSANAAAEAIDNSHFSEVLGTMAGDNTILVVVHNESEAQDVSSKLHAMISH
ncbi:MAG: arginine repressor [Clostridia bacterium]|nr:arginine repressor [Clostridia bacterium]